MSATYNWAYRPGVTNKYGFTVPAGADNARPTGWCYVALFGNDSTGNGSRQYPYRTITKACAVMLGSGNIVIGSGIYRESAPIGGSSLPILLGDGDVIIDISYIGNFFTGGIGGGGIYNLEVRGSGNSYLVASYWLPTAVIQDCIFNGAITNLNTTVSINITNCIFKNISGEVTNGTYSGGFFNNCTFVNCNKVYLGFNSVTNIATSCIFVACNISTQNITGYASMRNCLFYQCNWKMTTGEGAGGVLYPSVPSGYTYYNTLTALQAGYYTATSVNAFTNCVVSDPLFNNAPVGDYSLQFASPAKNLSFFGTFVGAKSIAYPIKASATESTGSFDFSTNINLTVADDSITLTDPTLNAEIKTKMIINSAGRQIQKFPIYGFNADRNGQYIDSIPDLNTNVKNPGDTLTVPASYLVETGAITYNSTLYQPGDRLTTVTGQTTFTTAVSGVLREILEAPERHTIMARFSDGGANVNSGDALVVGNWYYVASGSITYDSVVYNAGSGFKAVDTNPFSGSGAVIIALGTETFQHYEPGIQPTSNNTGDTRTGSILRGNGDPAYVRGGYGVQEFPINSKFIQLYYIINVSNLKP